MLPPTSSLLVKKKVLEFQYENNLGIRNLILDTPMKILSCFSVEQTPINSKFIFKMSFSLDFAQETLLYVVLKI